jgi:hypothetical protein
MKKYKRACEGLKNFIMDSSLSFEELMFWLEQEMKQRRSKEIKKKSELLRVLLHTQLLQDVFFSMKGELIEKKKERHSSGLSKIKFALLTGAGILVAACQGFDGMASMLSVFTLSSPIILGIGFIFSLCSVMVFCGFDLVKVSKGLGVKLREAYKLLDAYLLQMEEIKAIRKRIENY